MILVTGATGLLGSHLVLHLVEKGLKISAIYRSETSISKTLELFKMYDKESYFQNINWIEADINDIPSLEIAFLNIKYVYHCAAKVSFDPQDEEKLRKVNIEGTANIVNFCLAKKVKKICYVSSIAALGDLPEFTPEYAEQNSSIALDEETDWNPEKPHSDYAISKYGAEMEVWRGHQEGLNVVIVNPGVILGPVPKTWNRNQGSFKIIKKVSEGLKFFTIGSTGFIGVDDVVKCMTRLMNSETNDQRYILISENLTYKKLTQTVAADLKVKAPKTEAKTWMTEIAWRVDWVANNIFLRDRMLSKSMAKSLHSVDLYSNSKATNFLNYSFEPMESVIEKIANRY